jgi:hypothetical protein
MEGLRKTIVNLNQDIRYLGQDLNQGLPKYDAEMLTTQTMTSGHCSEGTGATDTEIFKTLGIFMRVLLYLLQLS